MQPWCNHIEIHAVLHAAASFAGKLVIYFYPA